APEDIRRLTRIIEREKIKVAVIDPLYLALVAPGTTSKSADLFAMGSLLGGITELGIATGCTMILVHHFRKGGQPDKDDPAGLEELSQSGASEWARQWVLMQRRSAYRADGNHAMWLRLGGSAGHAGLYSLDVVEGLRSDPGGRKWEVSIEDDAKPWEEARKEREDREAAKKERVESEHVERLRTALRARPAGETLTGLSKATGLNGGNTDKALLALRKRGEIEDVDIPKGRTKYPGVRLRETLTNQSRPVKASQEGGVS
ncbi:MAG: AAA family ATPase, partial [Planctomycetota bacterium]